MRKQEKTGDVELRVSSPNHVTRNACFWSRIDRARTSKKSRTLQSPRQSIADLQENHGNRIMEIWPEILRVVFLFLGQGT